MQTRWMYGHYMDMYTLKELLLIMSHDKPNKMTWARNYNNSLKLRKT